MKNIAGMKDGKLEDIDPEQFRAALEARKAKKAGTVQLTEKAGITLEEARSQAEKLLELASQPEQRDRCQ